MQIDALGGLANVAGVAMAAGSSNALSIATTGILLGRNFGSAMTDPDLKELDDLLPADLVAMIQGEREWLREDYWRTMTGLPDIAYRTLQ